MKPSDCPLWWDEQLVQLGVEVVDKKGYNSIDTSAPTSSNANCGSTVQGGSGVINVDPIEVQINTGLHKCASRSKVSGRMASQAWVAERAIPYRNSHQQLTQVLFLPITAATSFPGEPSLVLPPLPTVLRLRLPPLVEAAPCPPSVAAVRCPPQPLPLSPLSPIPPSLCGCRRRFPDDLTTTPDAADSRCSPDLGLSYPDLWARSSATFSPLRSIGASSPTETGLSAAWTQ
ncbi:hypothetical protein E2562_029058 [Oryza meyeriana var. granulata]|uniref:Uncharacterized protein n=1 Tax=Oryza meyeriana var. granulata TaxID=110450 RepID=A0A6G1CSS7_9ORYZ|nr:hypothetical protein E2562_029058 [Oryza meyeriana var. granulata]